MFATAALADGAVGKALTLDVEFREHWGGIFAAHPWLSGPGDSYLGFTARGGGASGEHSHALNLWQHFALVLKAGRVKKVQATLDRALEGDQDYDKICLMTLETESGLIGRCIQDVVTQPPRKWARIQGSSGAVEWDCGSKPGQDSVNIHVGGKRVLEHTIYKARPDDFITELRHIEAALQPDAPESPILLERGLDTMLVLSAAHLSAHLGRTVAIDYQKGYNCDALSLV
jgi:predicted dehydrogenase